MGVTDKEKEDLSLSDADSQRVVEERRRGLQWILVDSSRQIALEETEQEPLEKAVPYLQPLWTWFRLQTENQVSIFRLCFK